MRDRAEIRSLIRLYFLLHQIILLVISTLDFYFFVYLLGYSYEVIIMTTSRWLRFFGIKGVSGMRGLEFVHYCNFFVSRSWGFGII